MDFSLDGTHLLTRDFLTVKIWDMRMENKPCKILPLHEHLDQRLCELYENDCIFDKFQLCSSPSSPFISTGSYGNMFKVVDWQNDSIETISLDNYNGTGETKNYLDSINWEEAYQKKTLFTEWHSAENCFAVAVGASLYIYNQTKNPKDPL